MPAGGEPRPECGCGRIDARRRHVCGPGQGPGGGGLIGRPEFQGMVDSRR